jgi:XTP/dITP diphosphohydrolase
VISRTSDASASKHTLVLASKNKKKLAELRNLVADLPFDVRSSEDILGPEFEVEEDGLTFEENANKKALLVAKACKALTLADDSGLEVDALGGAPGVHSARYAALSAPAGSLGNATDAANNLRLLAELSRVGAKEPITARFRCVLALVDPYQRDHRVNQPRTARDSMSPDLDGEARSHVTGGSCEGRIVLAAAGAGGFGYDPHFFVEQMGRTMAELSPEEKAQVGHRGNAFAKMRLVLEQALAERDALMNGLAEFTRIPRGF